MHSTALLTLLFGATSVLSAPSRHITAPRALTQNDIILTGANGRMEVMSRPDYENALKHGNSSLGTCHRKDATVAVTEGYSIANSVGVSVSSTLTVVEDFLSTSFGVDYSETWTSTYNSAYTFTVKAGEYGIVVSNPKVTRHTGSVKIGCVGEAGETSTFQADSYTSQSYGGLSWVTGTISLCSGTTYPIPMCSGDGTLS